MGLTEGEIQPGLAPPAQLNFYPAYRFKPQDVYQEWHPMIIPLV
jgi:hypothetical protein